MGPGGVRCLGTWGDQVARFEAAQLGIEQPLLVRRRRLPQANLEVPRLGLRGVVLPFHCIALVERVQPAPTKRLGARSRCGAVAALPCLIAVVETVH